MFPLRNLYCIAVYHSKFNLGQILTIDFINNLWFIHKMNNELIKIKDIAF